MQNRDITEFERAEIRRWVVNELQHQQLTHGEITTIDIDGIAAQADRFQSTVIVNPPPNLTQNNLETRIREFIALQITDVVQQLAPA